MIAKLVLGRLPRPDGHFVGTRFVLLGGPLIPLESVYVVKTERHGDPWGQRVAYTHSHFKMKMHWGSVVLGYLRVWLLIFAFVAPFALMYGEPVDLARPEMFVSYGLLAAWLLSLIVPSFVRPKLTGDAAKLAELTGIHLRPEDMAETTRTALRTACMQTADVRVTSPAQVLEDAPSWDERARRFVWGACWLLSFADPAWRAAADGLHE